MVLNSSSSKRPMGGQPKSEASSWSSPDVRALWEEPTEAISQKPPRGRRNPLPSGRGGCQRRIIQKNVLRASRGWNSPRLVVWPLFWIKEAIGDARDLHHFADVVNADDVRPIQDARGNCRGGAPDTLFRRRGLALPGQCRAKEALPRSANQ